MGQINILPIKGGGNPIDFPVAQFFRNKSKFPRATPPRRKKPRSIFDSDCDIGALYLFGRALPANRVFNNYLILFIGIKPFNEPRFEEQFRPCWAVTVLFISWNVASIINETNAQLWLHVSKKNNICIGNSKCKGDGFEGSYAPEGSTVTRGRKKKNPARIVTKTDPQSKSFPMVPSHLPRIFGNL